MYLCKIINIDDKILYKYILYNYLYFLKAKDYKHQIDVSKLQLQTAICCFKVTMFQNSKLLFQNIAFLNYILFVS